MDTPAPAGFSLPSASAPPPLTSEPEVGPTPGPEAVQTNAATTTPAEDVAPAAPFSEAPFAVPSADPAGGASRFGLPMESTDGPPLMPASPPPADVPADSTDDAEPEAAPAPSPPPVGPTPSTGEEHVPPPAPVDGALWAGMTGPTGEPEAELSEEDKAAMAELAAEVDFGDLDEFDEEIEDETTADTPADSTDSTPKEAPEASDTDEPADPPAETVAPSSDEPDSPEPPATDDEPKTTDPDTPEADADGTNEPEIVAATPSAETETQDEAEPVAAEPPAFAVPDTTARANWDTEPDDATPEPVTPEPVTAEPGAEDLRPESDAPESEPVDVAEGLPAEPPAFAVPDTTARASWDTDDGPASETPDPVGEAEWNEPAEPVAAEPPAFAVPGTTARANWDTEPDDATPEPVERQADPVDVAEAPPAEPPAFAVPGTTARANWDAEPEPEPEQSQWTDADAPVTAPPAADADPFPARGRVSIPTMAEPVDEIPVGAFEARTYRAGEVAPSESEPGPVTDAPDLSSWQEPAEAVAAQPEPAPSPELEPEAAPAPPSVPSAEASSPWDDFAKPWLDEQESVSEPSIPEQSAPPSLFEPAPVVEAPEIPSEPARGVATVPTAQRLAASDLPPNLPRSSGRVYGTARSDEDGLPQQRS
ncbi:hypothetical protein STSO111631_14780 [Stackebrandtia soli]